MKSILQRPGVRPLIQEKLRDIGYIFVESDDMCVNNAAVIFVTGSAGRAAGLASKSDGPSVVCRWTAGCANRYGRALQKRGRAWVIYFSSH
ncbi:hypothetical protein CU665_26065 [Pseudomonas syringae pv. actinidifoliorum]|nr:hypothetical protein [Pseudomonas syringae pv. actinidifoliorum]NAT36464.1 hypothetical protein [Pseudomonas syringae pv. actinidifoliorum]